MSIVAAMTNIILSFFIELSRSLLSRLRDVAVIKIGVTKDYPTKLLSLEQAQLE